MKQKLITGLNLMLADIVLLVCCLSFPVFVQKMDSVQTSALLWIFLAVTSFFSNLLLQKRRVSLGALLSWNLVWMALSCATVCLTLNSSPGSILLKVIACIAITAVEGHGCYLALTPVGVDHAILFLDALLVVFALFLAGCGMHAVADMALIHILGFVSIGWTLISLIFLRTFREEENTVRGGSPLGRVFLFTLLGGIVLFAGILCAALSAQTFGMAHSLWQALRSFGQSAASSLRTFLNAFSAFFARFHRDNSGTAAITKPASSASSSQTEWVPVPDIPAWIPALIGIFALFFLLFFLVRVILYLRHQRIETANPTYRAVQMSAQTAVLKKSSFPEKLRRKLTLAIRKLRQRKTAAGLAVLARRKGASLGFPMQKDETWHSYVRRLCALGDTASLSELADYLEHYFYSRQQTFLSSKQYRRFSAGLRHMKKPENADRPDVY